MLSTKLWRTITLVMLLALCFASITLGQSRARRSANTPLASQEIRASVVTLMLEGSSGQTVPLASGFFILPNTIATSYTPIKNVKDVSAIRISVNGHRQAYSVERIWILDRVRDVALLRVKTSTGKSLPLGSSEKVLIGEKVFIANQRNNRSTLQEGSLYGAKIIYGLCYVQIAPIIPQANGSPVINTREEVIGIVINPPETNEQHTLVAPISSVMSLLSQGLVSEKSGGVPGGIPGGIPRSNVAQCFEDMLSNLPPSNYPSPPPPPPPPPEGKIQPPLVVRKSSGVLAGEAIERPEPEYPLAAIEARASGPVVVEVTIGEGGNVINARALSGHPLLKDAAIDAARQWKFKPTKLSGVPVKVIGTITFNFNL